MRHLNQVDLARRWNLSPRTLENLRWRKQGPPFVKLSRRVVYRLEDIEAYERERICLASMPSAPPARNG
jgi:hypothetical protein